MRLPEHRAAARIAWRQAWRARGRTALVLTLIALPVMGLSAAGFMIKTAMSTPQEQVIGTFGTADLIVDGERDLTTADVQRVAPAGSLIVASRTLYSTHLHEGTLSFYNVVEYAVPADRLPIAPQYAFRRGTAPRAAGEAAVHPKILRDFGVRIGDQLLLRDGDLRLRVVGEVLYRESTRNEVIVVGPGTFDRREDIEQSAWFIDVPPDVSEEDGREAVARDPRLLNVQTREEVIEFRKQDQLAVTGASFGLTAMGLFCTGLIAAAAIGVGARRQLRMLGLVGAGGGEPRHVRAIVLWSGTVVGAVGSLIGVGLAVVTAYAATPHLDGLVGRIVGPVRLPFWILAGGVVLGILAATVAAVGPARYAARLQTVDSLAGRTPPPRPPGSLARRGSLAVLGGSVLVGIATASQEDKLLVVALIPTLGGFLLAIPLLVSWIGRASRRLPMSLRLAARQTARYGRRTGTAVAAATLALTFPIAVASFTRSDEAAYNSRQPIAENQMILGLFIVDPTGDGPAPVSEEMMRAASAEVPGSIVAPLRSAVVPVAPGTVRKGPITFEQWPVDVEGPSESTEQGVEFRSGGGLAIGDPTLLRAMGAEGAVPLLSSGKIIALGAPVDNGELRLRYPPAGTSKEDQDRVVDVPAVRFGPVKEPGEGILPRYVISETQAGQLGLRPGVVLQAVLSAPRALTQEQALRVKAAVSAFNGGHAEWIGDFRADGTMERLAVTGIAAAIALVIVAVAVALVGAESRREHAILVAVGAEPGTRRKMVAANAFLVAAIAGVLGAVAGFVPMAVILFARQESGPIIVPWQEMGLVALGAPLIAGLVAAMASREPKSLLRPIS